MFPLWKNSSDFTDRYSNYLVSIIRSRFSKDNNTAFTVINTGMKISKTKIILLMVNMVNYYINISYLLSIIVDTNLQKEQWCTKPFKIKIKYVIFFFFINSMYILYIILHIDMFTYVLNVYMVMIIYFLAVNKFKKCRLLIV